MPHATRPYHVHGQRPLSPDSIEIPAEAVARFLDRLEPAGGGCMKLRPLKLGRPRKAIRSKPYGNVVWTDETGRIHQVKAHRLALILRTGPIPEGQLACHRCDNAACVSGDHLYAGTEVDNKADRTRATRERKLGLAPTLHPMRRPPMTCVEARPG